MAHNVMILSYAVSIMTCMQNCLGTKKFWLLNVDWAHYDWCLSTLSDCRTHSIRRGKGNIVNLPASLLCRMHFTLLPLLALLLDINSSFFRFRDTRLLSHNITCPSITCILCADSIHPPVCITLTLPCHLLSYSSLDTTKNLVKT